MSDFREDFSTEYQTEGLSNNTVVWRYISCYLIYSRWSQLSGLNKLFSLIADVSSQKKRPFIWKSNLRALNINGNILNYWFYAMMDDNNKINVKVEYKWKQSICSLRFPEGPQFLCPILVTIWKRNKPSDWMWQSLLSSSDVLVWVAFLDSFCRYNIEPYFID